jgi:hypothetical protein
MRDQCRQNARQFIDKIGVCGGAGGVEEGQLDIVLGQVKDQAIEKFGERGFLLLRDTGPHRPPTGAAVRLIF